MDEKPKERGIIMVKIIQEFNMKLFEDNINKLLKDGYSIFETKVIASPDGRSCSWIAIMKKDI